jgi:methyl-accepting chemotaxis protein
MEASQVVGDTSQQVAQGAGNLSARVQQQASALEEASATMHQITNAVQTNTDSATQVAQLAHQVQDQSSAGVAVMQQTIDAMKSIQAASSKIADIVSIIDSIAFQTNLLALNAAVEAARAGEHGRGFAVVASEVRALAGKSADAAKDIKHLIEDSVQRIDAGTQLADQSGAVLTSISDSINHVASMIEAISTASQEQAEGINQVNRAIGEIDRVTQENSVLVEDTTTAAQRLNQEATQLSHNMSFFKTN